MIRTVFPLIRQGINTVKKCDKIKLQYKQVCTSRSFFVNSKCSYRKTSSLHGGANFLNDENATNYEFGESDEPEINQASNSFDRNNRRFDRRNRNENTFQFSTTDFSDDWLDEFNINKFTTENKKNLSHFVKNFYRAKETDEVTAIEIKEYLKTNSITITGDQIKPVLNFENLFDDSILNIFQGLNYQKPTPIQAVSWPQCLSGNNVVGIAQTGSGKTLAFIAPAIQHVLENKQFDAPGPRVIVLCPTRELAMQCADVAKHFSSTGIKYTCVYGGVSKDTQARMLTHDLDILIATPGRMLDFMSSGDVSVTNSTYLVLDEADRMLDMGFKPQIDAICNQIRPDRQVVMWSATWPTEIKTLATSILGNNYSHIKIGTGELTPSHTISHFFRPANSMKTKLEGLIKILQDISNQEPSSKVIIFTETKLQSDNIFKFLRSNQFRSHVVIHGDKSQNTRTIALKNFRHNRNCNILIATSVAARGLDIPEVKFVINFDMPKFAEEYVHRIGRCGRNGNKGYAIAFISNHDMNLPAFPKLIRSLKELISNGGQDPPKDLDAMLKACNENVSRYERSTRYNKKQF